MGRRTVSISDEVYSYIAERGRFGESIDDALRRLFELADEADRSLADHDAPRGLSPIASESTAKMPLKPSPRTRGRIAERKVSPKIADGLLHIAIEGGPEQTWPLPKREDHAAIKKLSVDAQAWAEPYATYGQLKAIHKALTESGYYNTGPRR